MDGRGRPQKAAAHRRRAGRRDACTRGESCPCTCERSGGRPGGGIYSLSYIHREIFRVISREIAAYLAPRSRARAMVRRRASESSGNLQGEIMGDHLEILERSGRDCRELALGDTDRHLAKFGERQPMLARRVERMSRRWYGAAARKQLVM